jgi:signal transduction histidine kinase
MAIDNARLYQEVEESSRTKDQFLAVLSHELRTPLTAILGWSNLLRVHRLEEKDVQAALDSIARNANSQAQLVEDLLEVSRIVTGKFYVDLQECDLFSIVKNAVETVQLSTDAKEIALSLSCPASPCRVCGDAQRLQQVALNLLSNAIKFTPPRGRINVEVQDNGSMVELSVSDSGQGISAEFLPHVFDRFRQSDSSVTREFGGLGLGLSIVKHIVDLHNGTIEVSSEGEGKGATFIVRLPQAAS